MSQPSIPTTVPYAEPALQDLLDAFKKDIFLSFNCHAVATVASFVPQDAATGYAKLTATMNYTQTFVVKQQDGSYTQEQRAYPALVDCPAIVVGGGPVALQMPVAPGDQCLILFNDRDLNNWWAGAQTGALASSRLHSFSDAMAFVGFSKWRVSDATRALLTNGNAQLGVKATANDPLVRIANNSTTLYTVLSSLIDAIEALTVKPGSFSVTTTSSSGTWPVTGTSGNASSTTALENARTALQGLLE